MKFVQIFVLMLVLKGSYDLVTIYLFPKSEGEATASEGEGEIEWNSLLGYTSNTVGPIAQWLLVLVCAGTMYLLRQVLRWVLPKEDAVRKLLRDSKPRKRESFLTCRVSDSTINTLGEYQGYESPETLSPAQLQVLLEELKFTVDEKFEEMESWIGNNEHESKLWLKRLERVETELSYIRHQIFILMSSNAKLGSTLSISDVPEARDHVETLKDLSTILAQVKKQFNEDEIKNKKVKKIDKVDNKVIKSNALAIKGVEGTLQTISEEKEDVEKVGEEIKVRVIRKFSDEKSDLKKVEDDSTIIFTQEKYNKKTDIIEDLDARTGSSGDRESNIISEKDLFLDKTRFNILTVESPEKERKYGNVSARREDAGDFPTTPTYKSILEDKDRVFIESKVIDESDSTNLINLKLDYQEQLMDPVRESQRSSSPRRTVRFAQEDRDLSPSKSPTWLGLKREPSPVRTAEMKGGSDSKVVYPSYIEMRGNKESASFPQVDDRRPSRRNMLEKELTKLERKASPSPPRRQGSRRSNVRSKVAEYIRGSKNL